MVFRAERLTFLYKQIHRLAGVKLALKGTCSLCHLEPETINHMLFRCTKAQELWQLTQCPSPSHGFTMVFEENMAFLFNSLDNQTPSETQESPLFCVNNAEEEASIWFEVNTQAQNIERLNTRTGYMERVEELGLRGITREMSYSTVFRLKLRNKSKRVTLKQNHKFLIKIEIVVSLTLVSSVNLSLIIVEPWR
ncbi:BnaC04g18650D [Brassica napus]|uniref:BnaC04g18650D protein n=4 Tax=Brassica TaxID=3705 RepID=A0A078GL06_BRANA|nr:BnaC04g18650D [Brassica napus]VDD08735.1 unnamed protein product [Brassica oleracea]